MVIRFPLKTLVIVVTLAAVGLVVVSRERALRDREREVVRKLQKWAAAEPDYLEIRYTTSFYAKPGYWNLVLHSLRERLGTQTVSAVYMVVKRDQTIPGEILAQCSDLQDVSVYLSPHVDLSQLTHAKNLRRLSFRGYYPEDIAPLAEMPQLERVVLLFGRPGRTDNPAKELAEFAIVKNLKCIWTPWAEYEFFTSPLRQARPDCKIGPIFGQGFSDVPL